MQTLAPAKSRIILRLGALFLLVTGAAHAADDIYRLDSTTDRTADFRLAQIGDVVGVQGEVAHQEFLFDGKSHLLRGRYGQDRSVVLAVGGDEPPAEWPEGYLYSVI